MVLGLAWNMVWWNEEILDLGLIATMKVGLVGEESLFACVYVRRVRIDGYEWMYCRYVCAQK